MFFQSKIGGRCHHSKSARFLHDEQPRLAMSSTIPHSLYKYPEPPIFHTPHLSAALLASPGNRSGLPKHYSIAFVFFSCQHSRQTHNVQHSGYMRDVDSFLGQQSKGRLRRETFPPTPQSPPPTPDVTRSPSDSVAPVRARRAPNQATGTLNTLYNLSL